MRARLMHTVEALDRLILFRQKPDSLLRRLMATEEAVRVAAQGELVALAVENGWQGDLWRCCIACRNWSMTWLSAMRNTHYSNLPLAVLRPSSINRTTLMNVS